MADIKPIETYYNGYRFRSRLEARTAVMLDVMNLQYEYEKEGYELTDGAYYLPDFYLPELDTHIEVKSNTQEGMADIMNKCFKAITWGGPIKRIIIISEIPNYNDEGCIHFPAIYSNDGHPCAGWWFFWDSGVNKKCSGNISGARYLSWNFKYKSLAPVSDIILLKDSVFRSKFYNPDNHVIDDKIFNPLTHEAYREARQARFEHGETPIL